MNGNGERFADLCATSDLVIGGSFFQHRRIHKATWVSLDMQTENQVDHFCIGKRFRRTLEDVRVRQGAGMASDYHLLIARLRLKLWKKLERDNKPTPGVQLLSSERYQQTEGIQHHTLQ